MPKTFFYTKQGSRLLFGVPTTGSDSNRSGCSPRFFLPLYRASSMSVRPKYEKVPFLPEKLKSLKSLTMLYQETVSFWESSEPDYPLLPRVKDQLKRGQNLLQEVLRL